MPRSRPRQASQNRHRLNRGGDRAANAARYRITARTRAVVPVHYAGQPADMDELRALTDDGDLARDLRLLRNHGQSAQYRHDTLVETGREQLMAALTAQGIENRLYFPPAHRQAVFADTPVALPVTDYLADHLLSLPFHSLLTAAELDDIATTVAEHLDQR